MDMVVINGKPHGKGRPRFTMKGHAYTPKQTVLYEKLIRDGYMKQCGHKFEDTEPLSMTIMVTYAPPRAATKKMREDMLCGKLFPTKKPDIDNVVKVVADAIQGVAYRDDVQIIELIARKRYAEEDSVMFEIKEVKQLEAF